jgi:long-chain acyl-CoA synthetase
MTPTTHGTKRSDANGSTPAGMLSGASLSRGFDLVRILLNERVLPRRLERIPEPDAVMDTSDQVVAWHHEGQAEGPLDPVYHLVARAVSRLCPPRGLVIDLGCGTGHFITHLATLRPDLFAIGFDLSPRMVSLGNQALKEKGLASRIQLRVGDMTRFADEVPPDTNVIVSLFSMHHLPNPELRDAALAQIQIARRRTSASLLIFDESRPRRDQTALLFPKVFTPDAPESFRVDSVNSLRASWTFEELGGAIRQKLGPDVRSVQSRYLPLFQVHWAAASPTRFSPSVEFELANENGRLFQLLRGLFQTVAVAPVVEPEVVSTESDTLPGFLVAKAGRSPQGVVAYEATAKGCRPIQWRELHDGARDFARGLAWLKVRPGDRIGIFIPNGVVWDIAQFGILWAGGIVVGLDPFSPPHTIADIISRSQCSGVIVDRLEDIKLWDPETVAGFSWLVTRTLPPSRSSWHARVVGWDELMEASRGNPIPPIERVRPENPAALVFTSGTTGRPKGLLYTHGQFANVRRTLARTFTGFGPRDLALCWLPLSNLFQRVFNFVAMEQNVPYHYLANPREIMTALSRYKPTLLIGVPRFFEKGRQGVLAHLPKPLLWVLMGGVRLSRHLNSRQRAGLRIGWSAKILHGILDILFLRFLRRVWGGRLRLVISGSAPCSPEVLGFFEAIGMPIHESYGVSENLMPVAVNSPQNCRPGSVGKPLPGQEVRLAPDGEVLVRGPDLHWVEFPDPNRLTPEGFWATGDLGQFDDEGYLHLVGRRSEVIKTSNGRKIALPQLEAHFRDAPGIDQIVIFGHGRPHVVALVEPLSGAPIDSQGWSALLAKQNELLLPYERLAGALILAKKLSPLTGELTPNLKLRRKEIERKHFQSLEALFAAVSREKGGPAVVVHIEPLEEPSV